MMASWVGKIDFYTPGFRQLYCASLVGNGASLHAKLSLAQP